MHTNKYWLVLLVFLTMGICAAEVPDLVGNWTASASGYFEDGDSYKLRENLTLRYVIVEQMDRVFTGNFILTQNGKEIVESFAGAIGQDNKTLYMAEFNDGYNFGTIISDDEFELIHLVDGETAAVASGRFHRIKA
jgi:hypothetical protein